MPSVSVKKRDTLKTCHRAITRLFVVYSTMAGNVCPLTTDIDAPLPMLAKLPVDADRDN